MVSHSAYCVFMTYKKIEKKNSIATDKVVMFKISIIDPKYVKWAAIKWYMNFK